MFKLVMYPHVVENTKIRLWVGAFHCDSSPDLEWMFHAGPGRQPRVLSPMHSARPPEWLRNNDEPRAFTGVFEFDGLKADEGYRVTVNAPGAEAPVTLRVRTLPAAIPRFGEETFNILLLSCFHQEEDKQGFAERILSLIKPRPDLSLLLGDQVYLDLPTLKNFPNETEALARRFERDYVTNWTFNPVFGDSGAIGRILAMAPNAFLPDDHEFWNNFPHASPIIQNSWTRAGRDRWREAAGRLYQSFQLAAGMAPGEPQVIEVDPVSIIMCDSRTLRDESRAFAVHDDGSDDSAYQRFVAWADRVIENRRVGMFVTGQSLFHKAAGVRGAATDFELPDYGDYGRITEQLKRITEHGLPVICITGDVHWGRMLKCEDLNGRTRMYEIISSPTSQVTTVGWDWVKARKADLSRLLGGQRNPWPRHGDADAPPDYFAGDKGLRNTTLHRQKGNHAVMLRLAQGAETLKLRVTYYPLHQEPAYRMPVDARAPSAPEGVFTLRRV